MNVIVVESILDCPFRKKSLYRYEIAKCLICKKRCNQKKPPSYCPLPITVQLFAEKKGVAKGVDG